MRLSGPGRTRALMFATTAAMAMYWGQAAAAEAGAAATGAAEEVEEVVVIGSQIRGAKETGALPVSVLGTEEIKAVGAVSGEDLFRALPQAGDVSFNTTYLGGGSANAARGDISTVSLRGLGQGNTLSLLNGRRMVLHPTSQTDNSVPVFGYNVNAVPVAGLARVEVLRDGAAALYGSDAVAGVVNNVLQADFHGLETEVQYGGAEGTHLHEFEAHMLAGKSSEDGRGNVSLFLGYTERSALEAGDQDYTATNDRRGLVGGSFALGTSFDTRSTSTPWGVFTAPTSAGVVRSNGVAVTSAGGAFHVSPISSGGCAVVQGLVCLKTGSITGAADRNLRFNNPATFPDTNPLPSVQRFNAFTFINYDLTDDIKAYSELGFYTAKTHALVGSGASLSSTPITVPASNYYNPFGATLLPNGQVNPNRLPGLNIGAAGIPLTITLYNYVDSGTRSVDVTNEQYRLLFGLRGKKFGFDWDSAALYSWATVDDVSDQISNTLLEKQLSLSTPDAYNPFSGGDPANPSIGDSTPNPQGSTAPFIVKATRSNKTTLALWDFKISRPDLLTLPGGPLGIAAGIEYRRETYLDNRDPRQDTTIKYTDPVTKIVYGSDIAGASPSPDVRGHRSVQSAYLELAVPVVGPDMKVPLVRSIDMQLAGRFENYSDVGSVAKPKIAASWDVFDGLRFRASWSEGFRAPNLEQLNTPVLERYNNRTDYILCEEDLRAKRITSFGACSRSVGTASLRSGNPDLKPETSTNFSYGLVFEPPLDPAFGKLTITADRWRIKQKGVVGIFDDQQALIQDYLLRTQGSSSPLVIRATPTADDVAAAAGTGIAPVGTIIDVIAKFDNLLPLDIQGVDVGVNYRFPETPIGDFGLSVNLTHLLKFYQSPSAQVQELIDAQKSGKINTAVSVPGAASLLRQSGHPIWKWSATLDWSKGPFRAALFTQYIDPVDETGILDLTNAVYKVDSQITYNLYLQYKFEGDGLTHDTTVKIGGRNITNEAPPLSSGGYLGNLYQPYGRYWYASISKSF
jgi:outer membrane receptor protein involved in Fe transport